MDTKRAVTPPKKDKEMPGIQELREECGKKAAALKKLVDTTPQEKWSADCQAQYSRGIAEIDALDAQISRFQGMLDATANDHMKSMSGDRSVTDTSPAHKAQALKAFGTYLRTGNAADLNQFYNASTSLTESIPGGGVLVPSIISDGIVQLQIKWSPMRQISRVIPVGTQMSKFSVPVCLGGEGSGWVGETDARPNTNVSNMTEVVFTDSEVYANVAVSARQEQDSQFDIASFVMQRTGIEFARNEGASFINGTGPTQPTGILTYPTANTVDETRPFGTLQYVPTNNTANEALIDADSIISLLYSLKPAYRQNCTFVMNSNTLAVVRQLKDSMNRYLWNPSYIAGQPQTLLGYPILEANDWPDIAANAFPIACGDFMAGYWITDRSITMLRDPFTVKGMVNFYTSKRVSGAVVDSQAIKLLKVAAA